MKQTWKVVTYMDARLEPYRTLVSFLGEALGPDYEVVLHDLTSEEGRAQVLTKTLAAFGKVDILINNAGYCLRGAVEECTEEEIYAEFNTNFFGAVRMIPSHEKSRLRRHY